MASKIAFLSSGDDDVQAGFFLWEHIVALTLPTEVLSYNSQNKISYWSNTAMNLNTF